jgi:hypothetical protein
MLAIMLNAHVAKDTWNMGKIAYIGTKALRLYLYVTNV